MTGTINEHVEALIANFAKARDERVRTLLDSGIAIDRLSFVTFEHCRTCGGSGIVSDGEKRGQDMLMRMSECPECPGLCVDGESVVRRDQLSA